MADFSYHCQQQTAIMAGNLSWNLYSGYGFLSSVLPPIPLAERYADFKARLAQKIKERLNG